MLLARGAAKVIAVDVGRGQLDPRLAADPRVRSLEGRRRARSHAGNARRAAGRDRLRRELHFAAARSAACPEARGGAGLARQPHQAAVRGRPRRPRQGPGRERSGARARLRGRPRRASRRRAGRVLGLIPSPILGGAGAKEFLIAARHGLSRSKRFRSSRSTRAATASPPTARSFPWRLPGERALVRIGGKRAELIEMLDAAPERAEPICRWFGACGGCAAQHMSAALYREWKRGLVVDALKREGVEAEVGALVDAHGAGRRRATFHARFPHGRRTRSASCARARTTSSRSTIARCSPRHGAARFRRRARSAATCADSRSRSTSA